MSQQYQSFNNTSLQGSKSNVLQTKDNFLNSSLLRSSHGLQKSSLQKINQQFSSMILNQQSQPLSAKLSQEFIKPAKNRPKIQSLQKLFQYSPQLILQHVKNAEIDQQTVNNVIRQLNKQNLNCLVYNSVSDRIIKSQLQYRINNEFILGTISLKLTHVEIVDNQIQKEQIQKALQKTQYYVGELHVIMINDNTIIVQNEDVNQLVYSLGVIAYNQCELRDTGDEVADTSAIEQFDQMQMLGYCALRITNLCDYEIVRKYPLQNIFFYFQCDLKISQYQADVAQFQLKEQLDCIAICEHKASPYQIVAYVTDNKIYLHLINISRSIMVHVISVDLLDNEQLQPILKDLNCDTQSSTGLTINTENDQIILLLSDVHASILIYNLGVLLKFYRNQNISQKTISLLVFEQEQKSPQQINKSTLNQLTLSQVKSEIQQQQPKMNIAVSRDINITERQPSNKLSNKQDTFVLYNNELQQQSEQQNTIMKQEPIIKQNSEKNVNTVQQQQEQQEQIKELEIQQETKQPDVPVQCKNIEIQEEEEEEEEHDYPRYSKAKDYTFDFIAELMFNSMLNPESKEFKEDITQFQLEGFNINKKIVYFQIKDKQMFALFSNKNVRFDSFDVPSRQRSKILLMDNNSVSEIAIEDQYYNYVLFGLTMLKLEQDFELQRSQANRELAAQKKLFIDQRPELADCFSEAERQKLASFQSREFKSTKEKFVKFDVIDCELTAVILDKKNAKNVTQLSFKEYEIDPTEDNQLILLSDLNAVQLPFVNSRELNEAIRGLQQLQKLKTHQELQKEIQMKELAQINEKLNREENFEPLVEEQQHHMIPEQRVRLEFAEDFEVYEMYNAINDNYNGALNRDLKAFQEDFYNVNGKRVKFEVKHKKMMAHVQQQAGCRMKTNTVEFQSFYIDKDAIFLIYRNEALKAVPTPGEFKRIVFGLTLMKHATDDVKVTADYTLKTANQMLLGNIQQYVKKNVNKLQLDLETFFETKYKLNDKVVQFSVEKGSMTVNILGIKPNQVAFETFEVIEDENAVYFINGDESLKAVAKGDKFKEIVFGLCLMVENM
ncbi:Conserved_hypothetical protein [Hexamita inflata]|uniref:Uncharacterized protein n=1 Tax=Hexamita inflata TaxID=28002 RepID=A0AA86NF41_9EUKA|nr:Conserved hypothetical protein [Hexamita inflata]